MLVVKTVELTNYLSYDHALLTFNREAPTIVIGQDKQGAGGALSNGSGKTSLFEAVLYGLFGKTPSDRHGDAAVKNFDKDCSVIVSGSSNGKDFEIKRYRKHSKHKNKLKFLLDGKALEGGTIKETQEQIEKVLGIDYDLILQTCYFSPASAEAFCGLTDAGQKGIFRAILNLDHWDECLERLKAQKTILAARETEVKAELNLLREFRKRDLKNVQEALQDLQDIDTKEQETAIKDYQIFLRKNKTIDARITKLRNLLDTAEADYDAAKKAVGKTRAALSQTAKQLTGVCDACGSPIDTTEAELECKALQALLIQEDAAQALALTNKEKVEDLYHEAYETKRECLAAKEQVEIFQIFLNSKLESKIAKHKRLDKFRADHKATVARIKDRTELLEFIGTKATLYKRLETIFGATGARTYLMKQVLPHLNRSLKTYSSMLCPLISVQLAAQKKMTTKEVKNKFDIQVVSPVVGGYKSLSTGEAKRVDLCIVFAFLDLIKNLGKQTNFLILDEILDNLDPVGEDAAIQMLMNLTEPNVFLISHKNSLSSRFSNVLLIEKNGNDSTVL